MKQYRRAKERVDGWKKIKQFLSKKMLYGNTIKRTDPAEQRPTFPSKKNRP